MNRGDLPSFTIMMGLFYLAYSAYYVSMNIREMKVFFGVRNFNFNNI